MWYSYLLPPLLGAIIGYGTNELAIRMLFRPFKPKYLFGFQLPFTPGIIPKEKSRLAQSIGEMVSLHLMDKETLAKSLLSDEMIEKVGKGYDSFVGKLQKDESSIGDWLSKMVPDVEGASRKLSAQFSVLAGQHIKQSDLGRDIADKVVQYAVEQTSNSLLGFIGADKLLDKLSHPIEKKLAKHIDSILHDQAEEIVRNMSDNELSRLLNISMSEMLDGKDALIEKGRGFSIYIYQTLISEQLPRMLDMVDVQNIVQRKIDEMDIAEVEKITYQVMSRELKAIVWLGALLGGLLGLVNLVFIL